jgi:hypothetical protein
MAIDVVQKHGSVLQVVQFAVHLRAAILARESVFSSSGPLMQIRFALRDLHVARCVSNQRSVVRRVATTTNGAVAEDAERWLPVEFKPALPAKTTALVNDFVGLWCCH